MSADAEKATSARRLKRMLREHGLDRGFFEREDESRSELIERLKLSFGSLQTKTRGEFFDLLAQSPGEVSEWFKGTPWRGVALLRAGFSPMIYESALHQNECYGRISGMSSEYGEITLAALAQGWKPDMAEPCADSVFACHPISKAIQLWIVKDQPEQVCKKVIEALAAACPLYGPERVAGAANDPYAPREELKKIQDHVVGILMARDQRSELETAAGRAGPKTRSPSI